MELEDLRTTWRAIESEISRISKNDTGDVLINHRHDVKNCLINRFWWGIFMLVAAIIFLGTSWLWAAIKMPAWWLCAFCSLLLFGIVAIIMLINKVKRINLGDDSQFQVMEQVLSIKKLYRNIELSGCSIIVVLVICSAFFTPVPYRPIDIVLISVAAIICFFLEYISYRSNIRKINKMQDWLD